MNICLLDRLNLIYNSFAEVERFRPLQKLVAQVYMKDMQKAVDATPDNDRTALETIANHYEERLYRLYEVR